MGMKNLFSTSLLIIFFIAYRGLQTLKAQQDTSKVFEWNGQKFTYYKVEKGKTLYGISKICQVTQDEIVSMNPEISAGLKAGMSIRIPQKVVAKENISQPQSFQIHRVKPQQTSFGISKMYGISIAELEKMNPEIKQGLKTGMELKVYPAPNKRPVINSGISDTVSPKTQTQEIANSTSGQPLPTCDELSKKLQSRDIKVALLLPFYLPSRNGVKPKARIGLDFYSGAKMALDSLEVEGYHISTHVFDVSNDSNSVDDILNNPILKQSDLIIGPLYSSAFIRIADFAKKNHIPAVSPFSQNDALLAEFPNVIKATPDIITQANHCGPILKKEHPLAEYYLVRNSNEKDKEVADAIKNSLLVNATISAESFHEIIFSSVPDLLAILSEADENVIIFPSSVKIQVIDFISRLNSNRIGKRITLVGLNEWNNYENIEFDHLNGLNFTFFAPSNSNNQSSSSKSFNNRLKKEFKVDPTSYSYQGFDVTYYFIKQVAKYGTSLLTCLGKVPLFCGYNSCYKFEKIGENDGFENQFNYLIQMDDFALKRLN